MEEIFNNPGIVHILSFVGGMFITLLGNYLKFASDIAFIKGQLSELIRKQEGLDELSERYAKLEKDFAKATLDLDKALKQIKFIEFKVLSQH